MLATVGGDVGGDVLEGNHAAIWSASVLGRNAKDMTEPLGISLKTELLIVTVVAVTVFTVVPGTMFAPKTDMPALIPVVAAKANVVFPEGQSALVVAMTGRIA